VSDRIPLYDGSIQGNRVGCFTRGDLQIDVIKPGFDSQGRSRQSWTQFVIDGVPVYEVKLRTQLPDAMRKFDDLWSKYIESDPSVLDKALAACRADRLAKFKDGKTEESPAPALSHDGRPDGKQYRA